MKTDRAGMPPSAAEALGCLIAPLPVVAVGLGKSVLHTSFDAGTEAVFALIVYLVALGFTILPGFVLYRLLQRIRGFRWWTSMLSGFAVGAMVMLLVVHPTTPSDVLVDTLATATSGLLFWTVQWRARARAP